MDLTPGLVQSAFELLGLIGHQRLTIAAVIEGLSKIAGMPTRDVLQMTQDLNWIEVDSEGLLAVTTAGGRLLDQGTYPTMLRTTILDYATILSPPWIQAARVGRARVLAFTPVGIQQMLVEAEVAEGTSADIITFWDQLASLARGQREERLTAIGRTGERLSIEHETLRTGRIPRWIAIDSNADGYDLLSIVDADNPRPLSIEVKTSTRGTAGSFLLTRNEWETALGARDHLLHLWDVPIAGRPKLACVTISDAQQHVPLDSGSGSWAQVEVPFAAFAGLFAAG